MEPLLERLEQAVVRYLLIGGQAVRLLGFPRFSMDWDLWIPADDHDNIELINQSLADVLDEPLQRLGPRGEGFVQTYQTPWGVLQFHLAPPGLPRFGEAEKRRRLVESRGVNLPCVCEEDLLAAKRAAGRPSDLEDIRFLEIKLGLKPPDASRE